MKKTLKPARKVVHQALSVNSSYPTLHWSAGNVDQGGGSFLFRPASTLAVSLTL
jgi:hypothetical protein